MNGKMKELGITVVLASLLLAGLVVLAGCKESEPTTPPAPPEPEEVATAVIEQTICPVMAGPIDKNFSAEYKGKTVYFCCAACKEKFEQEPEKYIAKLPQFKQ
jgi:YHS domain-containing protein